MDVNHPRTNLNFLYCLITKTFLKTIYHTRDDLVYNKRKKEKGRTGTLFKIPGSL